MNINLVGINLQNLFQLGDRFLGQVVPCEEVAVLDGLFNQRFLVGIGGDRPAANVLLLPERHLLGGEIFRFDFLTQFSANRIQEGAIALVLGFALDEPQIQLLRPFPSCRSGRKRGPTPAGLEATSIHPRFVHRVDGPIPGWECAREPGPKYGGGRPSECGRCSD